MRINSGKRTLRNRNDYPRCPILLLQRKGATQQKHHNSNAGRIKNMLLLSLILISFSAAAQQQTIAVETKDNVLVLQTDKDIVFNYLSNFRYALNPSMEPVKLKGLDAKTQYSVKEINLYPGMQSAIKANQTFSGDYLMTVGFNPCVDLRHTSVILEVDEVK
jgi:hypothetical protein